MRDREPLILSVTPAPGWRTAMASPEPDGPIEFWRLVGWALVEKDFRQDEDDEPNIERRVEGLIACGDGVYRAEDRELYTCTSWLFLGYEDRDDATPDTWVEEAKSARKSAEARAKREAQRR